MKTVVHFFDVMEDHVRIGLSHHPFIYSIVGGTGVVLFWRGVWHTADALQGLGGVFGILFSAGGCIILGILILISTGLFVALFIGDSIIMSGISRDKKVIEKTEDEIVSDTQTLKNIAKHIHHLEEKVHINE